MIKSIKQAVSGRKHRTDGETQVAETTGRAAGASHSRPRSDEAEVPPPVEAEGSEEPPVEIDMVFEILKNQRRRYVLRYLGMVDEQITLSELAEQIAAWECEKEIKQITSQERKRVYVGLYQCHLLKMDDVSAISYNKPRGKIEPGENMAFFERYLPPETDPQRRLVRSHWAVLALSALSVLSLSLLGTPVLIGVGQLVTVVLVGVAFVLSLLYLLE